MKVALALPIIRSGQIARSPNDIGQFSEPPDSAHCRQRSHTRRGILAVAVVAAETDAEAERLATSMDLNRLLRDQGQYRPLPSVEEALAYPYTERDRAAIARNRSRLFVGSPAAVMQMLEPMIAASQADELMVITAIFDHEARKRSYSLLADAFGLKKKAAA